MLHSFSRIFVHLVWSTKNREPFLVKTVRPEVESHILQYARANGTIIDTLAVQLDHVHALVLLKSDQALEDIVKLLKGESSHWINDSDLLQQKFAWQRGYWAESVSPSVECTLAKVWIYAI